MLVEQVGGRSTCVSVAAKLLLLHVVVSFFTFSIDERDLLRLLLAMQVCWILHRCCCRRAMH